MSLDRSRGCRAVLRLPPKSRGACNSIRRAAPHPGVSARRHRRRQVVCSGVKHGRGAVGLRQALHPNRVPKILNRQAAVRRHRGARDRGLRCASQSAVPLVVREAMRELRCADCPDAGLQRGMVRTCLHLVKKECALRKNPGRCCCCVSSWF